MHKYLSLIILLISTFANAQNLVRNGSFSKSSDECPIISPDLEDIIAPWTSTFGAPNYYHMSCGDPGSITQTNNTQAFDGEEFMRIHVYGDTGSAYMRDYLHGELSQPLDSGKYYRVTFYVKPVNNDGAGYSYGVNNIGMFISDSARIDTPANRVYEDIEPQVFSADVIDQENYWTAICGVFMAKGGEEFITIGNFSTDAQTDVSPLSNALNPQRSYYLVDYVELVENDLPALPHDTIICDNKRIDLNISGPDVSVVWSDGSTNENFLITEPGTYTARISNLSCSYTDTIKVELENCEECKMYTANAFTPNGDGTNDEWRLAFQNSPESECELLEFRVKIYDRWGRKVFESTNINTSWNGRNTDNAADFGMGTYSFVLDYTYSFLRQTYSIQKRGFVNVIR